MEKRTGVRWFISLGGKWKKKERNNINQRGGVIAAVRIEFVGASVGTSRPSASLRACLGGRPWGTLVIQLTTYKNRLWVSTPVAEANDGSCNPQPGQRRLNAPVRAGTRSEVYELSHGHDWRLNPHYRLVIKPPGCTRDAVARGLLFIAISCEMEKETC